MKSLITENEKLRIRSMHISERLSLLKEDDNVFADLLPIPQGTAAVEVVSTGEKINTNFDKAYDYKLSSGKYYYSLKGKNNWVEAKGKSLDAIKTKVTFP